MFEQIDTQDAPLRGLVNNAGILFQQTTLENLTAERINRSLPPTLPAASSAAAKP